MSTGSPFPSTDAWRAIVLYGLNTATYKIALGECLRRFAQAGQSSISLRQLAEAFLDVYAPRIASGKPQLLQPDRRTVVETVVEVLRAIVLERGMRLPDFNRMVSEKRRSRGAFRRRICLESATGER